MVSWEGRELTAPMRCPLEPGKALSLSPRCLQGHAILSHWLPLSLSFLEEAGTVCARSEASELPGPMGPVPLTTLWKDLGEGSQNHCLWRNVNVTTTVPNQSGDVGSGGPRVS